MLSRVLRPIRRASAFLYRVLLLVLLSLVYVAVIPFYAVGLRIARPRVRGWQRREDRGLASLDRLRSPF